MADAVDSKSIEEIPRAGSSPASGTILNILRRKDMSAFRFQCPECGKYTYHVVSDTCLRATCMEVRCKRCRRWLSVVFDPVKCLSGFCIRINNQSCKKFANEKLPNPKVRPVFLKEL